MSFRLPFLLLAALIPLNCLAQSAPDSDIQWYEIEVIVFLNNHAGAQQSEAWRDAPIPASLADAIDPYEIRSTLLGSQGPGDAAIELLPAREYQLVDSYTRLDRSPRYTPLIHLGWRQPVHERQLARDIRLHTNEPAYSAGQLSGSLVPGEEIASHRLDGTLRLSINRYLHADADLYYRNTGYSQTSTSDPALQGIRHFNLKESRRIRSNELHYFDHPLFGLLLNVRPYEKPAHKTLTTPAQITPQAH